MKKLLPILLFLLISHVSFAQKYAVKGRVLDNTSVALPSATVLVLQAKDSSLVNFGATDVQGAFEIKGVSKGDYLFKVSFLGFDPYFQKIVFPEGATVLDMGTVKLQPQSNQLKEVLVQGEKSPVVIKKDTIEFNAGSFKTQPNAAVEELLKKLPGVEVDAEGNVSMQGERVNRVTVDGKEFFGRDPKMATKNLPADAIDKVQVFDKKSDQATFSGIDDGQREKTINLQLKEEKRNSAFGNVMAGVGTDERYQARASINRFKKGQQLSFLGMANNVNSQGFGFDEYTNFNGGMSRMGGGMIIISNSNGTAGNGVPLNMGGRMNGLMNTQAGGLNFNNQLNKKTEANGSYFFNNLNQNIIKDVERDNLLNAGNPRTTERTTQDGGNLNHRGTFSLDYKLDSLNSVKVTGSLSYNEISQNLNSLINNFGTNGQILNASNTRSNSDGDIFGLNSSILFRHRFAKAGRFMSVNADVSANQNDTDGAYNSDVTFANGQSRQIRQHNEQESDTRNLNIGVSHTEPLGNRQYLESNYTYRANLSESNREVYDLEGSNSILNADLSNMYESLYLYHRLGVNYKLNRLKYNLTLGTSLQQSDLNGEVWLRNTDKKQDINRDFYNILPTARFNYDFANNRRLNFNYETMVQEPSIRQLQPVADISNPLNIYIGNENLIPSYMHQLRLNYNSFDAGTLRSFFGMVSVMHTTNAIVSAQSIDENSIRTTRPVNVDYNTMVSAFANYTYPIKKLNSRLHFGANLRDQNTISVLNDVENDVNVRSATGNIRYSYQKDDLNFSVRADLTAQRTKYEDSNQNDQFFLNKTYAADANYHFLKHYNINATFDYLVYDNNATNFNQAIPLLNVSVSRQFLKNNAGELKLTATNLLDRDTGINQTANALYIERETLNSLGQYYMLSFTYNINKHLNPMGNSQGGSIRIFR
ncbi:outer membrane beta-barrel protein [Pontibacter cellulosilyticus]|uniref:Outer membrane beta-barrel protein n=1 Tax=Pontibacter cellulosilyticus TaxID=1720253 RepID=A0A923NAG9_9BACT|nr:outer membrane beta-barrel protein [Pontibacter cellulosilyticus]MBC5994649.1 outer membrane beta-barrel protein [Pontibacter cellulosilyticus]